MFEKKRKKCIIYSIPFLNNYPDPNTHPFCGILVLELEQKRGDDTQELVISYSSCNTNDMWIYQIINCMDLVYNVLTSMTERSNFFNRNGSRW